MGGRAFLTAAILVAVVAMCSAASLAASGMPGLGVASDLPKALVGDSSDKNATARQYEVPPPPPAADCAELISQRNDIIAFFRELREGHIANHQGALTAIFLALIAEQERQALASFATQLAAAGCTPPEP